MKTISREMISWAFRLFLDREPGVEKEDVEEKISVVNSTKALREVFFNSDEFKTKNTLTHFKSMSGHEPALQVDLDPPQESLTKLFEHTQSTWRVLGKSKPLWSVLSIEEFKDEAGAIASFYDSGYGAAQQLKNTLIRNRIDPDSLHTCLEFGCGLGRVTLWLARDFDQVYAYDISSNHLAEAKRLIPEKSDNIEWLQLHKLEDLDALKCVDLVYSIIVLQHNPPPIIERAIKALLRALNKGGVAVLQVPTYRMGYEFETKEYLHETSDSIEVHFFPQKAIFEIIRTENCVVLEVLEDAHLGMRYQDRSNTFVVLKPVRRYVGLRI